ncbi:MAG TPA: hypothetical protein VFN01_15440 [Marinobacter sp.]|uniref:hypothetical protein n=1 Tax=Marinobacter sp. TaxID=50741 RepID=UPI002D7FC455|nr:hypothetical protein [Marinobacter sp.]HET8802567.1 hypothetical protein [Marinobacter sp.]
MRHRTNPIPHPLFYQPMRDRFKKIKTLAFVLQSDIITGATKWHYALALNVAKQLRSMKDRFNPALPKGSHGKP